MNNGEAAILFLNHTVSSGLSAIKRFSVGNVRAQNTDIVSHPIMAIGRSLLEAAPALFLLYYLGL